jgi:hypothetical protein
VTEQPKPFFLIVADHDQGFFYVEGPMTDDRPWRDAAMNARNNQRRIECGPAAPDRDALAANYQRAHKLGPGSTIRGAGARGKTGVRVASIDRATSHRTGDGL